MANRSKMIERRDLYDRLLDYYTPDEIEVWMTSPHPQLSNATPRSLTRGGYLNEVHQILDRLDAEGYL